MLVCHLASDKRGRVALWAEDSALPPQHSPKPGRPPNVPNPRDHPFAASIEALQSTCAELNLPVAIESFKHTSLTLLLPSGRFGPEPSPDLVRDGEMNTPVDRVSPWTVPALKCDASVLGDVFDVLGNGDAGVVPGDTVGYWQTVVSLGDEFVRGGRVVPHLALREDFR